MSAAPLDEDAPAGHLPPVPRLVFNGVALVPFDSEPLDLPGPLSDWRLPGGEVVTTLRLLRLAREQGVSLTLILN